MEGDKSVYCHQCGAAAPDKARFCAQCGASITPSPAVVAGRLQAFTALDFSRDIKRLTEDFQGREWVFNEIDDWLKKEKSRFFLLTGEPGVGKSAIAARLTQVRADSIVAYHFCIAGNVSTIVPNTMLRSVAVQLGDTLPNYKEALVNTIKPFQLSIDVKQVIEKVEAGGKVIGVVIDNLTASNPEEELEILLRAPLNALNPPSRPVFILIDSLDEAVTYRGQINIATLLAKANDLPSWVRFVCTTRPMSQVLSNFENLKQHTLAAESQMNLDDIKLYVDYRVSKLAVKNQLVDVNVTPENLTEQVVKLSQGNFLYTKMLFNDIEAEQQPPDDLAALPKSLDDIYHRFLRRFSDKDWDNRYQPILGKLSVVLEPISEKQLANFTSIQQRQIRRSLAVVEQYLDILIDNEGNKKYRIFHQSLRDYLLDEARSDIFWCDSHEEHENVADYYISHHQNDWSNCDVYGLHWVPQHLMAAEKWKEVTELLLNFGWIERLVSAAFVNRLIEDYDLVLHLCGVSGFQPGIQEALQLVQGALKLSAHMLMQKPNQLPSQLVGRLLGIDNPIITGFVDEVRGFDRYPWLCPTNRSLMPPGGPLLRTFLGHTGKIKDVVVTSDGRNAVSGSDDTTLKVWDLQSGQEIHTLTGHTKAIEVLAVTSDGRAVSGSWDKTLKVWDLEKGEELHTLIGHTGVIWTVALTSDGRNAVSGSDDTTLKVWDLTTGEVIHTLSGHTEAVWSVAVTPDGSRAVSGSGDATLKVWDLTTGEVIHTLSGHTEAVEVLAITQDGLRAVSGSWDKTLKVWDLEKGEELHTLIGHTGVIWTVALTSDGRNAVSGSDDTTLKVWDLEKGKERFPLAGHTREVTIVAVTEDGRLAVSGSGDKTLKVWALEKGEELHTIAGHTGTVKTVAVMPDGQRVVSGSDDACLKVWDLESSQAFRLAGHTRAITTVAVTRDGRRAVTGSWDKTLKVWDLESGQELLNLAGHIGAVWTVAVTPDGLRAVSGSEDSTLKVWDLENGTELHTLVGHNAAVNIVAVTSDGRAVSGSKDTTLKVWDLDKGKELFPLAGHSGGVWTLALTSDGKRVISGSHDSSLKVWDLENRKEIYTLDGHKEAVFIVAVTLDGRRAVSGSYDTTLRVWDLENGTELHTLVGHIAPVRTVAVTPDGLRAVSGSDDASLKVWDLNTGVERFPLTGHTRAIWTVAVTPDALHVISGSFDRTLKVWDLHSRGLLAEFYADAKVYVSGYSEPQGFIITGDDGGRISILQLTAGDEKRENQ